MLELRRLRLLHALAGYGTVNAAAEALHLTGPAVSQQLATLEREVGVPLVQRQGRRLVLTDAGRLLVAHTDVLLDQLAAAEASVLALRNEVAGTVRLGAFSSATATLVATAWRSLAAEHGAGLVLRLTELEPEESLVALNRGELDLAVAHSYDLLPLALPAGCERHELLTDPVVAALPEDDPVARDSAPVALGALAERPWLSVPSVTSCHQMLQRACGAAGFVPRVIAQTSEYGPVLALVAAGAGVTLLPRLGVPVVPEGVALRPLARPVNRHVFAVTRRGGGRHPAHRAVLDHLTRAAADRQRHDHGQPAD
ncbi:DNA-binding transcriptional regulator, LysR family [Micromonospora viridifaciens]|uniref:DNA-binding transcriptional regulator, LysR family n=1 Tax=Micromonospora viridifaciens TaxID=1881 RepID=A0A1C4UIN9_MICVI|nr:LysR family transcriptional regulator [Micromonospora viridifaciens]SCE71527.1 DNA-binding transcriptional regulator, LysR family [Micromonospora viridifaciens]